jgi:hypothetical protein
LCGATIVAITRVGTITIGFVGRTFFPLFFKKKSLFWKQQLMGKLVLTIVVIRKACNERESCYCMEKRMGSHINSCVRK